MGNKQYDFKELTAGVYQFWYEGRLEFSFARGDFREKFEKYAIGQNFSFHWVGAILRQFHNRFPLPFSASSVAPIDRYSESALVEHYRSRGFRVVKPLRVSDAEGLARLESLGYEIEGLLNNSYYDSREVRGSDVGK